MNTYTEPVSRLLALGEPGDNTYDTHRQSRNYLELGLSAEHIPDLIRMATDEHLNNETNWDEPDAFGPLHSWRALGQLRAEAAIEPLLSLLRRVDEEMDDWVAEDLPHVFALIGPAAIPALGAYLKQEHVGEFAPDTAASGLVEIAKTYPETRHRCVEILIDALGQDEFPGLDTNQARGLRGSILAILVELQAREALPTIERMFAKDAIIHSRVGDWEDVQIEFGLIEDRTTPSPNYIQREHPEFVVFENMVNRLASSQGIASPRSGFSNDLSPTGSALVRSPQTPKKAKSRKKMAKASKKKNRKR
jgi:hypothetical protein